MGLDNPKFEMGPDEKAIEAARKEHLKRMEEGAKNVVEGEDVYKEKLEEVRKRKEAAAEGSLEKEAWSALEVKVAQDEHKRRMEEGLK